ncbi:hypothetical protein HNR46_003977 [Haloferula luteola]|uniref:Uncharacterized protein n=1 Tax=Haloferula luteola TaxID=595692 RepID=A0A840V9G7_9BACT|nr:hypothetical protein [Haloferula luteola]MBB5353716.1 hypothetical protein [Haloferula luteola]
MLFNLNRKIKENWLYLITAVVFAFVVMLIGRGLITLDHQSQAGSQVGSDSISLSESGPRFGEKSDSDLAKTSIRASDEREVFHGPAFRLYFDTGKMNPKLLDLAGIPMDKREEVQRSIERVWEDESRKFESRAVQIAEGDGQLNLGTYKIPGSSAVAEEFKAELSKQISSIAGHGAARVLLPYLEKEVHFAGLGRYDLEMTLHIQDILGERKAAFDFVVSDPRDSRKLFKGATTDPISYWSKFGSMFTDKFEGL